MNSSTIADNTADALIYTATSESPQAGDTCHCPYCGNPATYPVTTIPLLLGTTQLLFNVEVRRCSAPGCSLLWLSARDPTPSRHPAPPAPPPPPVRTAGLSVEPTHSC